MLTVLTSKISGALEVTNTLLMPFARGDSERESLLNAIGRDLKLKTTTIFASQKSDRYHCVMFERQDQPELIA